jgi:signal peptidase I
MAMKGFRFVVGVLSLGAAALLVSLLVASSVTSLATDWRRVVITSGSMTPLIEPGDVVVADPDVDHPVAAGTVVVFNDPSGPGLVTHRVVEMMPGGLAYRTKGDANQDPDSALVHQDDVLGAGRLLVPVVGLPSAWLQQGHPERTALAVAAFGLLLWLCRYGVLDRYAPGVVPGVPHRPGPRPRRRRATPWRVGVPATLVLALLAVGGCAWILGPQPARGAFSAMTDNGTSQIATRSGTATFYLKTNAAGNTTSSPTLPMSATAPSLTTLYNYDTDRDSAPGLLLAKDAAGVAGSDPTKVQRWNMASDAPLTLSGPARLRLWSAVKSFQKKSAAVQVALYECNPAGNNCQQFALRNHNINANAYPGTPGGWLARDLDLGPVSRTIPAHRILQLRLAVRSGSEDDMYFAYDTTAYPSALLVGP